MTGDTTQLEASCRAATLGHDLVWLRDAHDPLYKRGQCRRCGAMIRVYNDAVTFQASGLRGKCERHDG